jgi:hypothetical protein
MSTLNTKFAQRQFHQSARGFTLAEIIVGMAIGVALMAAVAGLFVVTSRLVYKNQQIDAGITTTRQVQERLYSELAIAINQINPVVIRPRFTESSGTIPARYAVLTYRVPIGSYSKVAIAAPSTSRTLTVTFPADVKPKAGDYLLMDEPNLGAGILIESVSNPTGTITVTLATTLNESSLAADKLRNIGAAKDKFVRIHRERKFATVAPETVPGLIETSPVTELHWYESTANTQPSLILSKNVNTSARYLFAQVPEDSPLVLAPEPAISWQFNYKTADTQTARMIGGNNANFYQTSAAEGLIMPKMGDPLNTESPIAPPPSTSTTRATTTRASTTRATTTVATTRASTVATTRVSTSVTTTTSIVGSVSTSVRPSTSTVRPVTTSIATTLPSTSIRPTTTSVRPTTTTVNFDG